MNDRRAQWLRFYEAALTGATRSSLCVRGEWDRLAIDAERIADAAMARIDARDVPRMDVGRMREALLWFADEGHYEDTYRHGAGFVDAVGLSKAREALGLVVDRPDGTQMPLAEALADGKAE